jgi:hypothetical protein
LLPARRRGALTGTALARKQEHSARNEQIASSEMAGTDASWLRH